VNVELRKVAWPTRAETTNYALVVFIALAVMMALIFGLDLLFAKAANLLFK
jgi:preprotein translocase SecE subunit